MTDLTPLRWRHGGLASAIRWKINDWLTRRPALLNLFGARLTVFDAFGAPGDTLLTAIVCRRIRQCFPRIRINCLTPNPELLRHDPHLDSLNAPEDYLAVWQWYLDLIRSRDPHEHVLGDVFRRLGIADLDYRARVYLTRDELAWARDRLAEASKPILSFNVRSKELVKNWPLASWLTLLDRLRESFDLLQLGDASEPEIPQVRRFAGAATMRESMALLACARLHIGPDSFLAHAANGLNVPSVIIFGGSRTPANVGYAQNVNLFVPMPCGPCQIHAAHGSICPLDVECMKRISVDEVHAAVRGLWSGLRPVNEFGR